MFSMFTNNVLTISLQEPIQPYQKLPLKYSDRHTLSFATNMLHKHQITYRVHKS